MAELSYFLNDKDKLRDLLIRSHSESKLLRMNDNDENILHIFCKDKRCKKSGSLSGTIDNSIADIIKVFYDCAPSVFFEKTRLEQQTPLHYAMKSGNIQKAKCMLGVFSKPKDHDMQKALFNETDFNGMRPIDLLSIRQDTEHKKNVLQALQDPEKAENYKITKSFEVYTWGTYDTFDHNKHEFSHEGPKRVKFVHTDKAQVFDPTSISHVEMNSDYSVALTESGKVYSWGMGDKGRLGTGEIHSQIFPTLVSFHHVKTSEEKGKGAKKDTQEFEQEYEKIKDAQKKIQKLGNKEDLLGMHNFIQRYIENTASNRKFSYQETRERRLSEEDFFDLEGYEEDFPEEIINYEQVKLVSKDALNSNIILSSIDKVFVTQIACSDNHTLICTNSGSVYGWG